MKTSGLNNYSQLDKNSNNKNSDDISIINPPIIFHIDHSFILSFSTYSDHTVWITKDGRSYSIGNNSHGQISGLLSKKILREDTEIIFKTDDNTEYKFISVVCGNWYTLYLISDESCSNFQLVYCYKYRRPNPLFLNIGSQIPRALFGGDKTSGVIDTEGGIIIITDSVFKSPTQKIERKFLPNNDRAVKLACLNNFVISLGQSGRVYECKILGKGPSEFSELSEFSKKTVIDISGSCDHCFAVLDDGRVFGRGSNSCCKLGLSPGTEPVSSFVEIESLKMYKIVSVFTGTDNSIFKTFDNKMIVCGYNFQGQLFIEPKETVFPPEKVEICSDFSFCVFSLSSVAFVGIDPPQNISNKKIDDFAQITCKFQTESCEIENLKKKLAQKEEEILKLKLELKRSEERMKDLEEENAQLKRKEENK